VAIRFTMGGLLMLGLLRILEPTSKLLAKDLLPMAGLGCLRVALGQKTFTFGVSTTSAANTGLIFATSPVWYGSGLAVFTPRYPGWPSSEACSSSGSWTACTLLQG
jgi:drug/metabolite transporter (DMT)-like permease